MEQAPFIFMSIFGFTLVLSAFWIKTAKDPRALPFFTPIHPISHMTLREAKKEAKVIAKYIALIGGCIILVSFICMFIF